MREPVLVAAVARAVYRFMAMIQTLTHHKLKNEQIFDDGMSLSAAPAVAPTFIHQTVISGRQAGYPPKMFLRQKKLAAFGYLVRGRDTFKRFSVIKPTLAKI